MYWIKELKESPFDETDIFNVLEEINFLFSPPLKNRILNESNLSSMEDYIKKLLINGHILIYYNVYEIQGITLFYANNIVERKAYISLVAVREKYQKQGVAKKLVIKSIDIIKKCNMNTISMKTWKENKIAANLYEKIGFVIEEINDKNIVMQYIIKN